MARSAVTLVVHMSLVLLVGCATPPEGPPYPESKAQVMKPGYAVLYVFREYAQPTGFAATIYIDGQEVASLAQGAFTWIYAKPGTRMIRSTWAGSQNPGAIGLTVAENETYYLEVKGRATANTYGVIGVVPIVTLNMGSGFIQTDPSPPTEDWPRAAVSKSRFVQTIDGDGFQGPSGGNTFLNARIETLS